MRVMLDTNVLISAILFPSDRMNALMFKATLRHRLVLSSCIIDELLDVVGRKFPAKAKYAETFLDRLPYELTPAPAKMDDDLFKIRDSDDYVILYSAIVGDVDLFVTGDGDFDGIEIERPIIVTPSEFLEKY